MYDRYFPKIYDQIQRSHQQIYILKQLLQDTDFTIFIDLNKFHTYTKNQLNTPLENLILILESSHKKIESLLQETKDHSSIHIELSKERLQIQDDIIL